MFGTKLGQNYMRFLLNNNPVSCSGGFYLRPDTQNEDLIYSLTLSAKAANQRVCIQANPVNLNGNRCLLNYIMHE